MLSSGDDALLESGFHRSYGCQHCPCTRLDPQESVVAGGRDRLALFLSAELLTISGVWEKGSNCLQLHSH